MTWPNLTREQCRDIDQRAICEFGMSGLVLMENAGRGCVDVLEKVGIGGSVVVLCGKGNNAGDGFVIARHLAIRGYSPTVLLFASAGELSGDAAANFEILRRLEVVPCFESSNLSDTLAPSGDLFKDLIREADWLVDALLGTGARGKPRPPFDTAIDWINSHSPNTRVLAVDVPSGLDCDTGEPSGHTVRADHTCTFAAMKVGFTKPVAKPYLGAVHVCDIGVPPAIFESQGRK